MPASLSCLDRLEGEAIHILREAVAESRRPVMLYSVGKDSSVLLHLARKAFHPARPPFPLLHVDTGWKFRSVYAFRDAAARTAGMELIVHRNEAGMREGVNPFTHGSERHTRIMKTQALRDALDAHRFDLAFGGARRDEEKSRAKERIFSVRDSRHRWEPRRQRPEIWSLYNARPGPEETMRVFPLSNWTELDIWHYIGAQGIAVPDLYFAAERPVVSRDGMLLVVDDDRYPWRPAERAELRPVRFRTLGCWPLTGAVPSTADTVPAIIAETMDARVSERQGRAVDRDGAASLERKKLEGYF